MKSKNIKKVHQVYLNFAKILMISSLGELKIS